MELSITQGHSGGKRIEFYSDLSASIGKTARFELPAQRVAQARPALGRS